MAERPIETRTIIHFKPQCTELTATATIELSEKIDIYANKEFILEVNFEDITYISSAGIGILLYACEHFYKVRITNCIEKVCAVFHILGIDLLIDIEDKNNEESKVVKHWRGTANYDEAESPNT